MRIDVVITTYNRETKVSRAIDSALLATKVWNGRVLLVDDASTDNTLSILKEKYKKELQNKALTIIEHEYNRGVTGAKNTGFVASDADWVVILDSDDTLHQKSFKNTQETLENHRDKPLVFFRVADERGQLVGQRFEDEEILSLERYLKHTSYGEALVAINRKIVIEAPYDEDLRGYEGIGCMRIIQKFGDAILSPVIARCYDRSGEDRLSSPAVFIRRANLIAKGHRRVLKEFSSHIPLWDRCLLFSKAMIYASIPKKF